MSLNLIEVQMRLRGAKESAAQIKGVSASMAQLGAASKAATAGAVGGMKRLAPAMAKVSAAGASMRATGSSLSSSFALPFAVVAAGSIKMSMDFRSSMRLIQTSAGQTEAQMERLAESVLNYAGSGQTTQAPVDLSKALYKIVSAGYKGAEAMDVLRRSSDLAAISQSDLTTTAHALASASNTGLRGTQNLTRSIGTMNAIVGAGNMTMDELSASFSSGILSSARLTGVSLTDVGAALATMTSQGIPASKAANNLRMAFNKMATPTGSALEALEQIGVSQYDMANQLRGPGGLPGALALLKSKMDGLTKNEQSTLISDAFGGARSGTTMAMLVQNLGMVRERFGQIANGADKVKDSLRDVKDTRGFKLKAALTQLKTAMIRLGDTAGPVLVPVLTKLVGWLQSIVKAFDKLPGPVKTVIIGLFAFVAMAGPVLMFIGGTILAVQTLGAALATLGGALAVVSAPVWLTVAAIAALAIGFVIAYKKVGWFRKGVDKLIEFVKTNWRAIVPALLGPVGLAVGLVISKWGVMRQAATDTVQWVKNAFNNVVGFFSSLPGKIGAAASGMWNGIKEGFRAAINFIIRGWNSLQFTIPEVDLPGPGPSFGGGTIGVPQIPELARGGHITSPGWSIVGDAGPELLNLPRGATVAPLGSRGPGVSGPLPSPKTSVRGAADNDMVQVNLYLDGRKVAEAVATASERRRAFA